MSLNPRDEDITAQQENLAQRRADLATALTDLATEAKRTAKTVASKRGSANIDTVYAAVRNVQRAEEAVDLAALDVHSASGHDI